MSPPSTVSVPQQTLFAWMTDWLFFHIPVWQSLTLIAVLALPTVVYALSIVWRHVRFIFVHWFRTPYDLRKRYGPGSWAVITGSSQGIGRGFAVELAKLGFNIVLMSRSASNLADAKAEVLAAGQGFDISVRCVVIDFSHGGDLKFWNDQFLASISDLDISVLVNNVGLNWCDRFDAVPEQVLLDFVSVNCTSQLMATRLLVGQMAQRSKRTGLRSAIVSLSSVAGQRPLLYLGPYSATKSFNDVLSRALSLEFHESIDIISLRPGYVASAMSAMTDDMKDENFFLLDRYECARGCLEKLGFVTETYGDVRHALYGICYALLPEWWLVRIREARLLAKKKKLQEQQDAKVSKK